jgi:hypothetical protein
MRNSSVDSATGIDHGCVIAFPREKTIGTFGAGSGASLPKTPATGSAVIPLRQDRNKPDRTSTGMTGSCMTGKQADTLYDQDADLRNFEAQNLMVQHLRVAQGPMAFGHKALMSAGSPMMSRAVMDPVAGSQMSHHATMSALADVHSTPSGSLVTAPASGGSDMLRKAAAARLVAVAQGGGHPSARRHNPPDKNNFRPSVADALTEDANSESAVSEGALAASSRTAEVSSYIAHMTQELAQMARASNLDLLAYFLDMAELEARMRNGSGLQSA